MSRLAVKSLTLFKYCDKTGAFVSSTAAATSIDALNCLKKKAGHCSVLGGIIIPYSGGNIDFPSSDGNIDFPSVLLLMGSL